MLSSCGPYYIDIFEAKSGEFFVNFVDSVSNNVYKYSNCEHSNALLAHKVQRIIGLPLKISALY